IFEPFRYVTPDVERDLIGYELAQLRDERGYKYYRSLHILKSSFDGDGINIGIAFHPQTGILKAMPKKPKDMLERDYLEITSGRYFSEKFSLQLPTYGENSRKLTPLKEI